MSSYELLRTERMNENTAFLKDLFKDTDIDVSFDRCGLLCEAKLYITNIINRQQFYFVSLIYL